MRKLTLEYSLSGDKTEVYVTYTFETNCYIEMIEKDYNLKNKTNTELYNTMLDDFEGEFDDRIASIIDKTVDRIFKEVE